MPSKTNKYPTLKIEKIAEYLGCTPNRVPVMLRNITKGGYAVEMGSGEWIFLTTIKVEQPQPAAAASVAKAKQILQDALTFDCGMRVQ